MRYFVVTPMAAFLMFLLLLLMVQLAGITAQLKPVSPPLQDELLFDSSELTVSKQAAQIPPAMQEAQLQESIQEFEPQTALEMSELTQADLESPSDELFEDVPLLDDLLLDEPLVNDALLTSKFNSDESTDLLANVAVAAVEKKVTVRKKVKRVARPKMQQPKIAVKKAVAKLTPTKTAQTKTAPTRLMAQSTAIQQTNSTSSAQAGSSQSIASTPLSRVKPKYPKRARRRGVEGVVTVAFVVNKNGTVAKNTLRIVSAKPAKVFNKAVISAVAKWRFAVNKRSYRTQQRLVFSLQKN